MFTERTTATLPRLDRYEFLFHNLTDLSNFLKESFSIHRSDCHLVMFPFCRMLMVLKPVKQYCLEL